MTSLQHLRVLRPAPNILAFYDGRVPGHRFAPGPNWVDDGALSLGIASYVIHDGEEALIYDTHVSPEHAAHIRATLEGMGITRFTVVLSHWHLDHVAGTAAFADCPVIANTKTAAHLMQRRRAIERGTDHGLPAINPLIQPTNVFDGQAHVHIGALHIDLIEANIHSDDATVIWMAGPRILLAGDTVEDCVTYVGEPERFTTHLADLDRLAALKPLHVLPNHGAAERIAEGGYGPWLIAATKDYIGFLQRCRKEPALRDLPLQDVLRPWLADGTLIWFSPYQDIHRHNIGEVLRLG
jgi:glyoxylase-like metal-dependent hydrolase (beta-lactamase superfamily II)